MIKAIRVAKEKASNSQTLFCNHKQLMSNANLNHNNDLLISKFAGKRLNRSDIIRATTAVFDEFLTLFQPQVASTWIISNWLIYCTTVTKTKTRGVAYQSPSVYTIITVAVVLI